MQNMGGDDNRMISVSSLNSLNLGVQCFPSSQDPELQVYLAIKSPFWAGLCQGLILPQSLLSGKDMFWLCLKELSVAKALTFSQTVSKFTPSSLSLPPTPPSSASSFRNTALLFPFFPPSSLWGPVSGLPVCPSPLSSSVHLAWSLSRTCLPLSTLWHCFLYPINMQRLWGLIGL